MAKIATLQTKNGSALKSTENTTDNNRAAVEKLAYQFFVDRGYEHGHQEEDWLRAEQIVKTKKRF